MENKMAAGKLKMWNSARGFGFIADDSGGPDMFLHVNEL
jgi:cold shock CspA family protein